jgi:hypothetical protein
MLATAIQFFLTTPVASALKNYCVQGVLLDPGGGFISVSELKRPSRNRFRSEAAINL